MCRGGSKPKKNQDEILYAPLLVPEQETAENRFCLYSFALFRLEMNVRSSCLCIYWSGRFWYDEKQKFPFAFTKSFGAEKATETIWFWKKDLTAKEGIAKNLL